MQLIMWGSYFTLDVNFKFLYSGGWVMDIGEGECWVLQTCPFETNKTLYYNLKFFKLKTNF